MASNGSTVPHHRHPLQPAEDVENGSQASEHSPLRPGLLRATVKKHLSFFTEDDETGLRTAFHLPNFLRDVAHHSRRLLLFAVALLFAITAVHNVIHATKDRPIPVGKAREHYLPIACSHDKFGYCQLWFRTWGLPVDKGGIPIVFVHGGPGNAIEDYFNDGNQRFFDYRKFFVVEIDQRGTGKSQPSVRDSWKNMRFYKDISITQICQDFELVREHLGIDQWLVWGGSFGSTLAIHYGELYPERSLALVLRGLYLDTAEEVETVYSRKTYEKNPHRLHEFNIFYNYAAKYVRDENPKEEEEELDPNDAERIMRVYHEMITAGDSLAIWHWYVFENNMMELVPENLYDPDHILYPQFRVALSVAFFETRLWIHGSFEEPVSDLLGKDALARLTMPMWVCQGQHDEVCPPQYGQRFASRVQAANKSPRIVSRFLLNATHEDTDPALEECLKQSLKEFVDIYYPEK